jgi:hypothetical protein
MSNPKKPWILNVDPGTLLLIVVALLLLPLLWAGFSSQ